MSCSPMKIVILGLSITSSWGNGHATTYRGLVKELTQRGHDVLFLERDMPWYASNRDLPKPPYGRTELYSSLEELRDQFNSIVRDADLVIIGSYVPEGIKVGEWVVTTACGITAFYDIDTPVTLSGLKNGNIEYLSAGLISRFDLYLSFTGGPVLSKIERDYGSPAARPLCCSFDPDIYYPEECEILWNLGYLGTYSIDRQPSLERLMLEPARRWKEGRFIVAGPQYPEDILWPDNVKRVEHLPPTMHRLFFNSQQFSLNITRRDMIEAGYSPSVRLFEAAACAAPVISDWWEGLDTFFAPDREILISDSPEDTLYILKNTPETVRKNIGKRARKRVLDEHTAAHRAEEIEKYIVELSQGYKAVL